MVMLRREGGCALHIFLLAMGQYNQSTMYKFCVLIFSGMTAFYKAVLYTNFCIKMSFWSYNLQIG